MAAVSSGWGDVVGVGAVGAWVGLFATILCVKTVVNPDEVEEVFKEESATTARVAASNMSMVESVRILR